MNRTVLALLIVTASGCDGLKVNPTRVDFAGATYRVSRLQTVDGGFVLTSSFDTVRLDGQRADLRHITPCPQPTLFAYDFSGDGETDIGLYSCSHLDVYVAAEKRLSETVPMSLEYTGERWVGRDGDIDKRLPHVGRIDDRMIMHLDSEAL